MLCGQHWTVWSDLEQKFVDITQRISEDERASRQFPVMNRLLLWYMLLHARMTENPPIVTFQAASGDRSDSDLAEVMDTVFKTVWRGATMEEVLDQMTAWLIPGGRAHLKSRIDLQSGELRPFVGKAMLQLLDPEGNPIVGPDGLPIEREVDGVPYDRDGEPRARLLDADGNFQPTAPPHTMREGQIVVDVLSPLEVRAEWGTNIPWHRKAWQIHRTFVTPEQMYEAFGIEMEPEITGAAAEDIAEIQRLLYGSGFFGAAGGRQDVTTHSGIEGGATGYIPLYEGWFRPCRYEGMEETPESPGGRLMICTDTKCIRDGARNARFPNTSPIRRFDFVNVVGRPQGTSPQEMLNGPTQTRNRMVRQIFEHTNLCANPLKLIDTGSGIKEGMVSNRPGLELYGEFSGKEDPVRYVSPPQLSADVYKALQILTQEFDDLGNVAGAMGNPPTSDASGELVKELRNNADRFVGPTQRRTVTELARMVDDWIVLLPIIWDQEKVLRVAGDDNVTRTLTVLPDMFKVGKVHVIPDIESMLPESRGERQNRSWRMYKEGVFGPAGTPAAVNHMLDIGGFPHMSQAARPGGTDRSMAEQNTGALIRGARAAEIPVFDWYDHAMHLFVLERYMKSPAYVKQPWPVQNEFVLFREHLLDAQIESQQRRLMREAMALGGIQALLGPGAGGEGEGPPAQEGVA
jgi:hypothetical protein